MAPTARASFAPAPATSARPAAPRPASAGTAVAPRPAASAVIGTPAATSTGTALAPRPSGTPRPTPRSTGGPSALVTLGRTLAKLLRTGQTRASNLSAQARRIIIYLVVATIVALGDQAGIETPATASGPAELGTGAHLTTAEQVLKLAAAEIGTVQGPDGGTPYHRAFGIADREPWCAVFVWWVFQRADGADSIGPKTAYTPTMAGWFRAQGRWSRTPVVGALVFYDWPDDTDRIQHVGIVESYTATTITTIEGNTSAGARGSQSNGDGVYRRTRPLNGSVAGFGLPVYGLPL